MPLSQRGCLQCHPNFLEQHQERSQPPCSSATYTDLLWGLSSHHLLEPSGCYLWWSAQRSDVELLSCLAVYCISRDCNTPATSLAVTTRIMPSLFRTNYILSLMLSGSIEWHLIYLPCCLSFMLLTQLTMRFTIHFLWPLLEFWEGFFLKGNFPLENHIAETFTHQE